MINLKKHTKIALVYFVLAALLGCVLRFFRVLDIPITYKYIVHAHSHIALLGWVYLALTSLLYKLYLSKSEVHKKYNNIFWFTQLTLIGMLLTFPFQGYAVFSIIFSTLFLIASYWFSWFFFKNVPVEYKMTQSLQCSKAAIVYLLISSVGPWALGAIMNTLGGDSIWYRLAIYFYLHFFYNGWMIMALLAVFLFILEKQQIVFPQRSFKRFFWGLNLGIIFSFFLSTLFSHPSVVYYVFGGVGAVLQLYAFYVLWIFLLDVKLKLERLFSTFHQNILKTIGVLWGFKMILQTLSAMPYFADLAVTYLDFTIGYLHWTFLGVVTMSLFLFLDYFKLLQLGKKSFSLYILGFALTEGLIFYKAIVAWQSATLFSAFYLILAVASLLVLLALLGLLLSREKNVSQS
ncbi:hypothetical protein [Zobellia nedashkovskayae]|uniref:hypothetical protein n=1 Tax=Zobellia nedashkovskayae TaxID=2779510 RepID=UPI00188A8A6C|nr:hypothetical protein [Zobellia nedashkovskayae]